MLAASSDSASVAVSIEARMGRGGADRTLCRVVALSVEGARLHSYAVPHSGSVIALTLPRAGHVAATIERSDGFTAECRFATRLDDAVFAALVAAR